MKQPRRALAAREAAAWTAPTRYARQAPQTMRCHVAHAMHTRITKHASALALLSTRLTACSACLRTLHLSMNACVLAQSYRVKRQRADDPGDV